MVSVRKASRPRVCCAAFRAVATNCAVLAGAAAVDPALNGAALALALVLFLWTPPHFWSLAIAYRPDYEAARVPMLPVVVGDARCARIILANTVLLVAASLLPLAFGLGWLYALAAGAGGALFIAKGVALVCAPGRNAALANFRASLVQLVLLLAGAMLDVALGA